MDLPPAARTPSHILSLTNLLEQSTDRMRHSKPKAGLSFSDASHVNAKSKSEQGYQEYYQDPESLTPRGHAPCAYSLSAGLSFSDTYPVNAKSKSEQGYQEYYQDPESLTPRGHAPCAYSLSAVPDCLPDTDDEHEVPKCSPMAAPEFLADTDDEHETPSLTSESSPVPDCLPDTDDEYERPNPLPNLQQPQFTYPPPQRASNVQPVKAVPNLTTYPIQLSPKLMCDAASQTAGMQAPASLGSRGHPHLCAEPCKFFWKPKGCKDGSQCDRCHVCEWPHGKNHRPTRRLLVRRQLREQYYREQTPPPSSLLAAR